MARRAVARRRRGVGESSLARRRRGVAARGRRVRHRACDRRRRRCRRDDGTPVVGGRHCVRDRSAGAECAGRDDCKHQRAVLQAVRLDIADCLGQFFAIERQDDVLTGCSLEQPCQIVPRPRHRDGAFLVALLDDSERELRAPFRIPQDSSDLLARDDRGDRALCRDLLGELCRTKCFHCQPPPRCAAWLQQSHDGERRTFLPSAQARRGMRTGPLAA